MSIHYELQFEESVGKKSAARQMELARRRYKERRIKSSPQKMGV